VHAALLAEIKDNTPHGANLTFAIPILFFVVVSAVLFIRFRAPHTVPGHVALKSSKWAKAGDSGKAAFGADAVHAAVGHHAQTATVTTDAPGAQGEAPGTVQDGTAAPATGSGGTTASSEQVKPADDGTEDGA
jgi:hypothetical protein